MLKLKSQMLCFALAASCFFAASYFNYVACSLSSESISWKWPYTLALGVAFLGIVIKSLAGVRRNRML